MVSFQASLSVEERKPAPHLENPLSKKRKWELEGGEGESKTGKLVKELRLWKDEKAELDSVVELNLDAPLPLEWQRFLDIKSGQIYYYNTRTHKRTSRDPRQILEPPSTCPALDLELNLNCEPYRNTGDRCNDKADSGKPSMHSPSWVKLDADRQEMMAAVCMRCHTLVMMCKATPSCPNCKFAHPPSQSSLPSLKPGFRILCCED